MSVLYVLMFILAGVLSYVILYFVVKAAVRNGIVEARNIGKLSGSVVEDGTQISKRLCPSCGTRHDIDYPKCPICKHQYLSLE